MMKPFVIEVYENGKVSLPPFVTTPEMRLTLDELKRCRDFLDLIINNPDNFHVVKINEVANNDLCKNGDCFNDALPFSDYCQSCETKAILKASDTFKPTACLVCEGKFDNPLQAQLGICGKCMKKSESKPKTNKP